MQEEWRETEATLETDAVCMLGMSSILCTTPILDEHKSLLDLDDNVKKTDNTGYDADGVCN